MTRPIEFKEREWLDILEAMGRSPREGVDHADVAAWLMAQVRRLAGSGIASEEKPGLGSKPTVSPPLPAPPLETLQDAAAVLLSALSTIDPTTVDTVQTISLEYQRPPVQLLLAALVRMTELAELPTLFTYPDVATLCEHQDRALPQLGDVACAQCGTQFLQTRLGQRYCSSACGEAAWRAQLQEQTQRERPGPLIPREGGSPTPPKELLSLE